VGGSGASPLLVGGPPFAHSPGRASPALSGKFLDQRRIVAQILLGVLAALASRTSP